MTMLLSDIGVGSFKHTPYSPDNWFSKLHKKLSVDRQNIFTAVYYKVAQISRSVDADGIPHL